MNSNIVNMQYKRFSIGLNKYKLIPITEDIQKYIDENPNKDYYESLYNYNENHKQRYDQTKSVAGITDVTTNRLVFDFDDRDIQNAKRDALELCERLINHNVPKDQIQIYFSGNKGYHIELNTTESFSRKELENTLNILGEKLPTLDHRIVDEQRIIRIPLTKHQKTGLYKIPLTLEQLKKLTPDEVKSKAKTAMKEVDQYFDLMESWHQIQVPEKIKSYKESVHVEKKELLNVDVQDRPDFSNKPKFLSPAKFALQEGFFESGERHEAYMILASTYRSHGFSKEIAYNMLKATNRLQTRRTGQEPFDTNELWVNIVSYIYSDKWKGGNYSEKENKLLLKTIERYNIKDVLDLDQIKIYTFSELGGEKFTRYAKSFFETRIYTGLKDLDDAFPMCAGSNIGIVGAASSGKTAMSLNILKGMKDTGATSVFASLDMSQSRIYEKLLYSVTEGNISREMLYNEYINGNGKKYDEMVQNEFPNTYIFSKSAPSVGDLRRYLNEVQDQTGKPVRLLLIDYFERLNSTKSDDTSASKDIASGIQDLINDFPELTPITLYQPNKFSLGGGPDKPILNYSAIKGSSFIFQAARQILSIWRPFFNPEYKHYDKYIEMAILKNDLGELDTFKYMWNGKTGGIWNMTHEDEVIYKERIKERDQKENKDDIF